MTPWTFAEFGARLGVGRAQRPGRGGSGELGDRGVHVHLSVAAAPWERQWPCNRNWLVVWNINFIFPYIEK